MVALALVLWVLATVLVAVPVALVLRRVDGDGGGEEEFVDPAELQEAMHRHPSRRPKVA
ncbi:MAG: hypothetical protein JO148_02290 [Acidimicrobiia bacterium]|nr:hypothetical protein [Acidimicrobiia bacterium]